jgi:transcription elongation factor Elf1
MSELKPCPFCGEGEDTNCLTSNGTEGYFVECIFCGGGGPSSDGEVTL